MRESEFVCCTREIAKPVIDLDLFDTQSSAHSWRKLQAERFTVAHVGNACAKSWRVNERFWLAEISVRASISRFILRNSSAYNSITTGFRGSKIA